MAQELTNEKRSRVILNQPPSAAETLNTEMDGVTEVRTLEAAASWSEHELLQGKGGATGD